jgi:uncharacterized protein (DUF952 family)
MPTIYKICTAPLWREAEAAGFLRGMPIDEKDGYIHFSAADQVAETLRLHFSGAEDLVLAAVDTARLTGDLRFEPSRGGALFPHLYGELPLSAVLWAKPLALGPDGSHRLPDLPA